MLSQGKTKLRVEDLAGFKQSASVPEWKKMRQMKLSGRDDTEQRLSVQPYNPELEQLLSQAEAPLTTFPVVPSCECGASPAMIHPRVTLGCAGSEIQRPWMHCGGALNRQPPQGACERCHRVDATGAMPQG